MSTFCSSRWVAKLCRKVCVDTRLEGLLFAQGVSDYEPLKRNRRARLEELKTGDGRPLPAHLKAQISRELDRLELVLPQLKAVEAERDALLKPVSEGCPAPAAMLAQLKGMGPDFTAILWSEGLFRSFSNRRQLVYRFHETNHMHRIPFSRAHR